MASRRSGSEAPECASLGWLRQAAWLGSALRIVSLSIAQPGATANKQTRLARHDRVSSREKKVRSRGRVEGIGPARSAGGLFEVVAMGPSPVWLLRHLT